MRKVTLWDFFEDAIRSKADKVRELNREYLLDPATNLSASLWGMTPEEVQQSADRIEPYLGIGPGVLGGPATVLAKVRARPNYANQMQKWSDRFRKIRKQEPNLFNEVRPSSPGVYSGDLFFTPEAAQMYKETNTLFMPYTIRDPVTGVNKLVPMTDLGELGFDPALRNIAFEKIAEGKKVPLSDFARLPGGKWASDAFPNWDARTVVNLSDELTDHFIAPIGSAQMRYTPMSRNVAEVVLNRPEILTTQHKGLFDRVLNHEIQHTQSNLAGVASGTSPSAYFTKPKGVEGVTKEGLYYKNMDEILARAAEEFPATQNTLASIQAQFGTGDQAQRLGTQHPIFVRERLKHPKFGHDYMLPNEHYGQDVVDYLAKMGFGWLWK